MCDFFGVSKDVPQDWVHVYTARGEAELAVILSLLESENIKAKVARESVGRLYALSMDGLGEIKVFVPADSAEKATELIESGEKG